MVAVQKHLASSGIRGARRFGLFALLAVVALALAFGTLIPPPETAHAGSNEPWLYADCIDKQVEEGDDFRLLVRTKYDSGKTMRVFWYTIADTADESDYEHLYAERQASNRHQSEQGKMGRDFHTLEDIYPESDETFKVWFNNSVDHGTDGECYITIKDDDGVGIFDLEVRSVPGGIPVGPDGQEFQTAYTAGDVILITAKFTHPVTTKNPETDEETDYAGLYLQVGENRRIAHVLRGDGTDNLIFGYTVQADDVDTDGISVESGWAGTGLYYNEETRDGGLWPVNPDDGRLNRIFHGLADDPDHPVMQVDVGEPIITPPITTPPIEKPIEDDTSIVEPPESPELPLGEWAENAVHIESNLHSYMEGELTAEDGGRDWFSFEAIGGENYIVEMKNQMVFSEGANTLTGYGIDYVEGHLVDPSILEIVDEAGEQVLSEQDLGGFTANFARAFFTPQEDGTYYIAAGAGREHRAGLGFYSLSLRADDHADDYRPHGDIVIHPGESIKACIDSDVAPDDPGLNPWEWAAHGGEGVPIHGLESLDDRDVFRFEIAEEGTYRLSVSDGPPSVGIWATWEEVGHVRIHQDNIPVESFEDIYLPGTYMVTVGTPYRSSGNTGTYTVSLDRVEDVA